MVQKEKLSDVIILDSLRAKCGLRKRRAFFEFWDILLRTGITGKL